MKNNQIITVLFVMLITTVSFAQNERTLKLNNDSNTIEVVYYHSNGAVSQTGAYTFDGKLQGDWLTYDTNGVKTAFAKYDEGKKIGTWYFYQKDVLQEVNYSDNRIVEVVTWKDSETKVVSNF